MRPLTSTDALFLASDNHRAPTNISSLAILDRKRPNGDEVTIEDIRDLFAERLHLLAPLRWKLVEPPLDITHPYWIDVDPDLEYHVIELALPPPADERTLADKVAWLSVQRFDRSRPLWEAYFIRGLQDDRVALMTKFHHAAMDGVSGTEVMAILLDHDPNGRAMPPAPKPRVDRVPGDLELLARGLADMPRQQWRQFEASQNAIPNLDLIPQTRSLPGVKELSRFSRAMLGFVNPNNGDADVDEVDPPPVERARFNAQITAKRRLELLNLSLTQVKAMKNVFGTTVNDVLLALCAGALRTWLGAADELPTLPLVAMVPVSIRKPEEQGTWGNAVAAIAVAIPTDEPDQLTRLERTRDAMRAAKQQFAATPAALMREANDMLPPMLFAPAMRAVLDVSTSELASPPANLVISNVPGSQSQLYCKGAAVRDHYPVSVLADSLGLNITVFSYMDVLNVGLVADPTLVPELSGLSEALSAELDSLVELAAQTQAAQDKTPEAKTPSTAKKTAPSKAKKTAPSKAKKTAPSTAKKTAPKKSTKATATKAEKKQ